jgi:tRNA(Ile)-lysidine synthase
MASSRRSPPADGARRATAPQRASRGPENAYDAVTIVRNATRAAIATYTAAGASVAVACSGGRDSTVLLDAAHSQTRMLGRAIVALHVHHGLSGNADRWAEACAAHSEALAIPFLMERVLVPRVPRKSLENEARMMRYQALARMAHACGAAVVMLAHHQDDQAETLLLHLLRGSGPRGLAAMPQLREGGGVRWLRPLLDLPRATIDAYVAARALRHVEDESNASTRHRRNALRHTVIPALRTLDAGYPATLARAAGLQAEAAQLMHDLARSDAAPYFDGATLQCAALRGMPAHRARNLLRWFLATRGLPPPSHARLEAMLSQLAHPREDSATRIRHAGANLGVFRGRIFVYTDAIPAFECEWPPGEALALPHGTLRLMRSPSGTIDLERLFAQRVIVRSRAGGERIALAGPDSRRALKSILREAALPPWERQSLPLVFSGGVLAAVPGLGVDASFRAGAGATTAELLWQPGTTLSAS